MDPSGGVLMGVFFLLFAVARGSLVDSPMTMKTSSTTSGVRDPREYCATEEFRPRCPTDQEVIVITEAEYGRMTFGECVKQDYGYLGCSIDVLDQMDDFCSGKRDCNVRIPDSRLEEVNVCPKEFKAYLNVSFECVEVEKSACSDCSPLSRSSVAKITRSRGFIGSVATLESPSGVCGSAQCPWYIEVQSGQTINLTLYDFSSRHSPSSGHSLGQCTRLAVIKEAAHLKETPVCYRQNRIQAVYSSVSQSIQIHVVSKEVLKTKGPFLIQYEVIGCPDLQPPENARLKRMGDKVVVECRDTPGLRFESRCVDSKWEGYIGTCPGSSLQTTIAPSILSLPLGVLVTVVLGIALVIGVLIVTVGVVCLKRQQSDLLSHPGNVLYVPAGQCYELREDYSSTGHSSTSGGKATGSSSEQADSFKGHHPLTGGRRNVYAHARMESRPLPSLPNIDEASGERGPCGASHGGGRVLHAVELGPHVGPPYPYRLHVSTLGRTPQKSTKSAKNSKRKDEGKGGRGGGGGGGRGGGGGGGGRGGGTPIHSNIPGCSTFFGGGGGPSGLTSFPPSAVPQHYTVLDPIEVQQQLTGTLRTGGGRTVGPPVASAQGPSADASPPAPPKPPLMPSATACQSVARGECGEGGIEKGFDREITLRPTRQSSTRAKTIENDASNSGNSSWP